MGWKTRTQGTENQVGKKYQDGKPSGFREPTNFIAGFIPFAKGVGKKLDPTPGATERERLRFIKEQGKAIGHDVKNMGEVSLERIHDSREARLTDEERYLRATTLEDSGRGIQSRIAQAKEIEEGKENDG